MKPPETVYRGERRVGPAGEVLGSHVTVFERGGVRGHALALQRSLRVRSHSPTGFEWGYGGSGPNQLALALLLDATRDVALSVRCYQWFAWGIVAAWGPAWSITAGEIVGWVERWQREQRQLEEVEAGIQPYTVGAEGGGA